MTAIVTWVTPTFRNASRWAVPHALAVLVKRERETERRRSHEEKSVDIGACNHPAGWVRPLLGRFSSGPKHDARPLSFRGRNLDRGGWDRSPVVPSRPDHLRLSLEQRAGPLRVPGTHAECAAGCCGQWQLRHKCYVRQRANHLGQ